MVSSRRICCNANTLTDFQCLARLFKNKKFPLLCRSTSLLLSRKEKKSIGKISPQNFFTFFAQKFSLLATSATFSSSLTDVSNCTERHFFYLQILDYFAKRSFPKIGPLLVISSQISSTFQRHFLLQFAIIKCVLEKRFDCSCLLTIK